MEAMKNSSNKSKKPIKQGESQTVSKKDSSQKDPELEKLADRTAQKMVNGLNQHSKETGGQGFHPRKEERSQIESFVGLKGKNPEGALLALRTAKKMSEGLAKMKTE